MIETEHTPNPDTLKFLPGKKVSEIGPVEFLKNDNVLRREVTSTISNKYCTQYEHSILIKLYLKDDKILNFATTFKCLHKLTTLKRLGKPR